MPVIFIKLTFYVLIALLIGAVAQRLTGYHKLRFFTTLLIGIFGVAIGDFIAHRFRLWTPFVYWDINILWAIVGAVIFIFLFRLIRGRW